MKIIIFHSFKGGQGRSTTLANLGCCLYRLGHKVALLDLDLDSPGLAPKFDHTVFSHGGPISKGVVDYLWELKETGQPDIRDYCVSLSEEEDPRKPEKLILIPSGIASPAYFEKIHSHAWERIVGDYTVDYSNMVYFDRLRTAIESLGPDYLLVDLCSGITQLARAVLTAWAEKVVSFFSLDMENLDGTSYSRDRIINHIPDVRTDLRRKGPEISVIPVLSRIGPFVTAREMRDMRVKAAAHLFDDSARYSEISITRADPDLYSDCSLHIPPTGRIKNVVLTRDYLELLLQVDPDVLNVSTANREAALDALLHRLGVQGDIEQKYKFFRMGGGIMLNMTDESDDPRNVSFKVRTFCSILDDIHSRIAHVHEHAEEEFTHAGTFSGARFGANLLAMWKQEGTLPAPFERVQQWCKFDSEVGFGRLQSLVNNASHPLTGAIEVSNNFLAHNREDHQPDLCRLMAGYVNGVLTEILGEPMTITHARDACMRYDVSRSSCTFQFGPQITE